MCSTGPATHYEVHIRAALQSKRAVALTESQAALIYRLDDSIPERNSVSLTLVSTLKGQADAILLWWACDMGFGVSMSTTPHAEDERARGQSGADLYCCGEESDHWRQVKWRGGGQ